MKTTFISKALTRFKKNSLKLFGGLWLPSHLVSGLHAVCVFFFPKELSSPTQKSLVRFTNLCTITVNWLKLCGYSMAFLHCFW